MSAHRPDQPHAHGEHSDATERLRGMIRARAVRVVFQPIVDLHDGMIVAYEALTRPGPEWGFKRADQLFATAERAGLLWELEEVTRAAAAQAAVDWPADVRLFFNCSPDVFADSRFTDVLLKELNGLPGLAPERIVLEITELSKSADDNRLIDQVQMAKSLGFQVAVDDAGAGTSGLNRMMVLRPEWIKLDRGLVHEIESDQFRQNLVRFFVHFARLSGVSVLAEGIETAGELSTLMTLGIRFGQGYFLGKPEDRVATMEPQAVAAVRDRWASVEAHIPELPQDMPLVRLCRSVCVATMTTTTADAARTLEEEPGSAGVIAVDGKRLVGWISRERVRATNSQVQLQELCRPIPCPLPTTATVNEALQMVCLREDHDLSEPLILVNGSDVVGALWLRDLMRAIVNEQRTGSSLRAPLTGLPARVRADQHIEEMIARGADPVVRQSRLFHADAAFVDIRRFADYNSIHGYEAGDRLIRVVGDQIRAVLESDDLSLFVAHLGDDRFFLTGPAGSLGTRLERVVQTFERSLRLGDQTVAGRVGRGSEVGAVRTRLAMGLRVLVLPGIFERISHLRDLYRAEQILRQRTRAMEDSLPPGQSMVLSDAKVDMRLSA